MVGSYIAHFTNVSMHALYNQWRTFSGCISYYGALAAEQLTIIIYVYDIDTI
jgi:hypothetical protein